MRRNRDGLLLLISLIPVMFLLYAFFMWQTTGQWPVSAPFVNLPNLPNLTVPAFLKPFSHLPAPLQRIADQLSQNWWTITVGVAAGLIFGVLLVGVVADALKVLFGFGRPAPVTPRHQEPFESE